MSSFKNANFTSAFALSFYLLLMTAILGGIWSWFQVSRFLKWQTDGGFVQKRRPRLSALVVGVCWGGVVLRTVLVFDTIFPETPIHSALKNEILWSVLAHFTMFIGWILFTRLWLCYFDFKHRLHLRDMEWTAQLKLKLVPWTVRYGKYLGSFEYLTTLLFIAWCVSVSLLICIQKTVSGGTDSLAYRTYAAAILILSTVSISAVFIMSTQNDDFWDIRNEMRLVAFFSILLLPPSIGAFMTAKTHSKSTVIWFYAVTLLLAIVATYVSSAWVLHRKSQQFVEHSKREFWSIDGVLCDCICSVPHRCCMLEKPPDSDALRTHIGMSTPTAKTRKLQVVIDSANGGQTRRNLKLLDVLSVKHGFKAFCYHLCNEYSLESLLFIIQLLQIKETLLTKRILDKSQIGHRIELPDYVLKIHKHKSLRQVSEPQWECEDESQSEKNDSLFRNFSFTRSKSNPRRSEWEDSDSNSQTESRKDKKKKKLKKKKGGEIEEVKSDSTITTTASGIDNVPRTQSFPGVMLKVASLKKRPVQRAAAKTTKYKLSCDGGSTFMDEIIVEMDEKKKQKKTRESGSGVMDGMKSPSSVLMTTPVPATMSPPIRAELLVVQTPAEDGSAADFCADGLDLDTKRKNSAETTAVTGFGGIQLGSSPLLPTFDPTSQSSGSDTLSAASIAAHLGTTMAHANSGDEGDEDSESEDTDRDTAMYSMTITPMFSSVTVEEVESGGMAVAGDSGLDATLSTASLGSALSVSDASDGSSDSGSSTLAMDKAITKTQSAHRIEALTSDLFGSSGNLVLDEKTKTLKSTPAAGGGGGGVPIVDLVAGIVAPVPIPSLEVDDDADVSGGTDAKCESEEESAKSEVKMKISLKDLNFFRQTQSVPMEGRRKTPSIVLTAPKRRSSTGAVTGESSALDVEDMDDPNFEEEKFGSFDDGYLTTDSSYRRNYSYKQNLSYKRDKSRTSVLRSPSAPIPTAAVRSHGRHSVPTTTTMTMEGVNLGPSYDPLERQMSIYREGHSSIAHCLEALLYLYSNFVLEDSTSAINVSFECRTALGRAADDIADVLDTIMEAKIELLANGETATRAQMKEWNIAMKTTLLRAMPMFDSACREVFRLLSNDSFFRFCRTAEFRQMLLSQEFAHLVVD